MCVLGARMGRIVAFVGGARSGKSRLALERAREYGEQVAFIATLEPLDDEMRARVEAHRRSRPSDWLVVEAPRELARALDDCGRRVRCVLVDCLTLWLSNMLCAGRDAESSLGELDRVLAAARSSPADAIFVSNDVGCGIVPENALARAFRDLAGLANQRLAQEADEAYWVVCGKAIRIT